MVQYCCIHHTHDIRLGYLRMLNDTRMKIAAKLQQGVTITKTRILDDIRDSLLDGVTREHLVTRQDIHNIRTMYNMAGVMGHTNDLTSVSAWVEVMRTLPYDRSILMYKVQGVSQTEEMDNIGSDDFLLAIQTEFQKDMLQKFGNTVICIDATHGTNMYDFNLITLLHRQYVCGCIPNIIPSMPHAQFLNSYCL